MDSNRTNLDDLGRNSSYLVLSIAFIILSVAGLILFVQIKKPKTETPPPEPTPTPEISAEIPTDTPNLFEPTLSPVSSPILPPPPTPTKALEPSPTPLVLDFQNPVDKFSVVYRSDRQLNQDTEASGNRYTFYRSDSTITVHVGSSWSWSHPGRTFSSEFLVAGQPAFRYDIAAQTIVDVQKDNLLYTIQCIHHANDSIKSECQDFLSNFKFL